MIDSENEMKEGYKQTQQSTYFVAISIQQFAEEKLELVLFNQLIIKNFTVLDILVPAL